METETQKLLNELHSLNLNWKIQIEYSYQRYIDNSYLPYLIVTFGNYINNKWYSGFISKKTGEFLLENAISYNKDTSENWYECFEGGFEENINDCLNSMILNLRKYIKEENIE